MTSEEIRIGLRVLDADRVPLVQDPLLEIPAEVGRPPGLRAGDELGINLAIAVGGLPVKQEGTIYFHLVVSGETLGILPLRVRRLQQTMVGIVGP